MENPKHTLRKKHLDNICHLSLIIIRYCSWYHDYILHILLVPIEPSSLEKDNTIYVETILKFIACMG